MLRTHATVPADCGDRQPPATPAEPPAINLYGLLLKRVKSAGLLERRSGFYVRRIAATAFLFAAGWPLFVWVGDSWWQMLVAVFLAFVFTQIGFVGHEAGHQQITAGRRNNDLLGLLHADLAVGLSYGWWVDKHNRHHAHPNQEGNGGSVPRDRAVVRAGTAVAGVSSRRRPRRGSIAETG